MMAVLFSPTDNIARQQAISTRVASRGIGHPKIWVIQRFGSSKDMYHPKKVTRTSAASCQFPDISLPILSSFNRIADKFARSHEQKSRQRDGREQCDPDKRNGPSRGRH